MDCEEDDDNFSECIEKYFVELDAETDAETDGEIDVEVDDDLKYTTDNICKNEDTEFVCFNCFKEFETRVDLLEHIEIEHFTFICNKCDKKYPTEKRLKKHLSNAHLTGRYQCPLCDRKFTRKDHCKDHVYSHSRKPLFCCKYENCKKTFRQKCTLMQHERIHSSEYRKTCPICKESVVQLSKHVTTHLTMKQHPCSRCHKSFTRRSYLVEHEKIHLGETGFICDECQMEFNSSNVLYKHKRSKHSEEKYLCEIPECRQEFNRKDNMMSHMKRMHKSVVKTTNTKAKD